MQPSDLDDGDDDLVHESDIRSNIENLLQQSPLYAPHAAMEPIDPRARKRQCRKENAAVM